MWFVVKLRQGLTNIIKRGNRHAMTVKNILYLKTKEDTMHFEYKGYLWSELKYSLPTGKSDSKQT